MLSSLCEPINITDPWSVDPGSPLSESDMSFEPRQSRKPSLCNIVVQISIFDGHDCFISVCHSIQKLISRQKETEVANLLMNKLKVKGHEIVKFQLLSRHINRDS